MTQTWWQNVLKWKCQRLKQLTFVLVFFAFFFAMIAIYLNVEVSWSRHIRDVISMKGSPNCMLIVVYNTYIYTHSIVFPSRPLQWFRYCSTINISITNNSRTGIVMWSFNGRKSVVLSLVYSLCMFFFFTTANNITLTAFGW